VKKEKTKILMLWGRLFAGRSDELQGGTVENASVAQNGQHRFASVVSRHGNHVRFKPRDLFCRIAVWLLLTSGASAQSGGQPSEFQVKAAFLYNFAKFVEWPSETFPNASGPIILGLLGGDRFEPVLAETIEGKSANGRPLVIRRLNLEQDLKSCHILFVSGSEQKRVALIAETLRGARVLTVGESSGFARQGGMINFTLEENKIHFEANPDAAMQGGLKFSSKLLALAKIVRTEAVGGKN
jgi:hypothetical protein